MLLISYAYALVPSIDRPIYTVKPYETEYEKVKLTCGVHRGDVLFEWMLTCIDRWQKATQAPVTRHACSVWQVEVREGDRDGRSWYSENLFEHIFLTHISDTKLYRRCKARSLLIGYFFWSKTHWHNIWSGCACGYTWVTVKPLSPYKS